MDYIYKNIKCEQTINDDGSIDINLKINELAHKALKTNINGIDEWIVNFIHTKTEKVIGRIYKREIERHLEAGTLPAGATKDSLVMDYVEPVEEPPPE
tara:strand:- start:696 stop:989 length:294 start_codon:yes stop_codon:yes gene_type:complete